MFQSGPAILPLTVEGATYRVTVEVGGRRGRFRINPSSPRSGVRPEFLPEEREEDSAVTFGGRTLGTFRPVEAPGVRDDGVLGRDLLDGLVVGLDRDAGTLAVWTETPDPETVDAWVGSGAVRLPHEIDGDGRTVRWKTGGGEVRVRLSLVLPGPVLSSRFANGFLPFTTFPSDLGRDVPYGTVDALDTGAGELPVPLVIREDPPEGDQAIWPLVALPGSRFALDGPRSRLVLRRWSPEAGVGQIFAQLLGQSMPGRAELSDGRLRLVGAAVMPALKGASLETFGGRPVGEWLAELGDPARRAATLRALALRHEQPPVFRLADGRLAEVRLKGSGGRR